MRRKRVLSVILIIFFIIILFSNKVFANNEIEKENNNIIYLTFVVTLSIIFVVVGSIFYKSKKSSLKYESTYYPPDGDNPIILEYYLKEKVTKKGLVAALLYFANKGYIEFKEEKEDIKIVKVKKYEGNNKIEKMYLDIFFGLDDSIDLNIKNMKERINKIYGIINNKRNECILYSEDSKKKIKKLYIMILIILFLMFQIPLSLNMESVIVAGYKILMSSILVIPFMVCLNGFAVSISNKNKYEFQEKNGILKIFVGCIMLLISLGLVSLISKSIEDDIYIKIGNSILIICAIILYIFIIIFPKKNELAQEKTYKIKNYRKSLKKTDIEIIKTLIEHNEKYFYYTLPYAYILDIEDFFIEKFEIFVKEKPNWFISEEKYNIYEINVIIYNIIEKNGDANERYLWPSIGEIIFDEL